MSTEQQHRKAGIRQRLDRLEELGIIRSYMIRDLMEKAA